MAYDDVPHIQAECSTCSFVFDLKWGLSCPRCHSTGVKWARLAESEYSLRAAAAQNQMRETLGNYMDEQAIRLHDD